MTANKMTTRIQDGREQKKKIKYNMSTEIKDDQHYDNIKSKIPPKSKTAANNATQQIQDGH